MEIENVEYETITVSGRVKPEIDLNLRHQGKWNPAKWRSGKKIEGTGYWDCCGSEIHYGENCPSLAARKEHQMQIFREKIQEEKRAERMEKARKLREEWENARYKAFQDLGPEAELRSGSLTKDDETIMAAAARHHRKEDPEWLRALQRRGKKLPTFFEQQAYEKSKGRLSWNTKTMGLGASAKEAVPGLIERVQTDPLGPIPMILKTLEDSRDDIELQEHCLQQLITILPHKDATERILGRGGEKALLNSALLHSTNAGLVELTLKIFVALIQSPDTQNSMMNSREFVSYMLNSLQSWKRWDLVLTEALSIMGVICQNEIYVQASVNKGHTILLISSLHRHKDNPNLLQVCFKLLTRLAESGPAPRNELLRHGIVETALNSLVNDFKHPPVMVAALELLLEVCKDDASARNEAVDRGGVALVLKTLQALLSEEELQIQGLKFLQQLAEEERGRQLLDEIKGSWQWLTQGCASGDRLLALHKGHFHQEDFMYPSPRGEPQEKKWSGKWSVQTLKEFMGVQKTTSKLSEENKFYNQYFRLINELRLLPKENESQGEWFSRIRHYQRENFVDIELLAKSHKH